MGDRATRRPMPIEQSILWKPLYDSHYIVASLQASDGGRKRIFIRHRVLAHTQAVAHAAHGRRTFGLLFGNYYECPVTSVPYLVIESATEQAAVGDEEIGHGIEAALGHAPEGKNSHVLGWYRSVANLEGRPPMSVGAIHATHFNQPWQTVLLLSDTASPPGGAFFLKDSTNSRWFYAPFYELAEQATAGNAPKTTCVSWQQYITADAVVLGVTEPLTPPPSMVATAKAAGRRTPADHSVSLDSGHYLARRERVAPADQPGTARSRPGDRVESDELAAQETSLIFDSDEPSKGVDRAVPSGPSGHRLGLADVAPQSADELPERVERRVGFIEKASRKKSTVDDRNQPRGSRSKVRLATDNEDTAAGDQPSRYIDLARAEGFFVAAKFDTQDESGNAETVWVLNEPYSGFLLTVASTSSEVVDASLHYNLRTDDAGLGRTPFPEHRDRDSHTIYMRETCLHSLRARCRRLRDTSSLVREWKVSPAMSFISPGEWQSIALASADDARHTVSTLNSTRAAELPEGVRAQFGIAAPGNRPA